jgi:hypothetical protein
MHISNYSYTNRRGPIARVRWAIGYDPNKLGYDPVPSSGILLRNQLKKPKHGHDLYQSYPTLTVVEGQNLTTCQPDLTHLCALAQQTPRPPIATPGVSGTGQVTQKSESSDGETI